MAVFVFVGFSTCGYSNIVSASPAASSIYEFLYDCWSVYISIIQPSFFSWHGFLLFHKSKTAKD
jgi:hypothetical protein